MNIIEIQLTLQADNPEAALRAWETLTRVTAAFGFDGLHPELTIERVHIDTDEDDAPQLEHDDTEGSE